MGASAARMRKRGERASPPGMEAARESTPAAANGSILRAAGQAVGRAIWSVADGAQAKAWDLYNRLPPLPSFTLFPAILALPQSTPASSSADAQAQVLTTASTPDGTNVTDTQPSAQNELDLDVVVVRSADSLHRAMESTFSNTDKWIGRYDRAAKILLQAMRGRPGMTAAAVEVIDFQARRFIDCLPSKFAAFASEELVADYVKRTRGTEQREVVEFLNNKNRIFRELNQRPDATDAELLAVAQSVLSEPAGASTPPVDILEPFVRYLSKLRSDLDWIDWDRAQKFITNPLQAIKALYVFNHGEDERVEMLQGLDLGKRLANGADGVSVIAGMSAEQRKQLDTASLLYELAAGRRLRLSVPAGFPFTETLPLVQQMATLREAFLSSLREEWQLSRMFIPDLDRGNANVFIDGNALTHAHGKTWEELVDDPSVQRIPGFRALDREMQKQLVKRKLDRTGEASEYRFGTLQHAMATVLNRLMLMMGHAPPDSFGTEAQLLEKFVAASNRLSEPGVKMVSPWLMLGQYLEQVRGHRVTSPAATMEENVAALQAYVKESFRANYEAPDPFDRTGAALDILRSRFANTTMTDHDLTQVKREFAGDLFGQRGRVFDERKLHTPLEHFVYMADSSSASNRFVFNGQVFHPRRLLQRKEREYNEMLATHPWVDARAKENLWEKGQTPNESNLAAARQAVLSAAHAQTESERAAAKARKALFGTPIVSNVVGVIEGLANRDWREVVDSVPVAGNLFEFGAGVVTGDVRRAIHAIPVLGSGLQVEEAVENGDSEDIALAVGGFLWDVGSMGIGPGASRALVGESAHVVMKPAEASNGHTIGLRNARALRKTLGVPAKRHTARADGTDEGDTAPTAAWKSELTGEHSLVGPGDPYGIELSRSVASVSGANAASLPDPKRFGAEYEPYRVAGPSADIRPNAAGIYEEGNHHFIREGDSFYAVRYDRDEGTWRVYDRNSGARWARPVEYKAGHWQYNDNVGLKGGAPLDDAALTASMDKLFNSAVKSIDAFRARRERFMRDNDRPYPDQSFDVEGLPFQWKPAVCEATGQTYFDIRTHGRPYAAMSIDGKRASPAVFAAHMTGYLTNYKTGTPIRLIACWSGLGGRFSFAQRLANTLGVPVLAYTGRVDLLKPAAAVAKEKLFMPQGNRRPPRPAANTERRVRRDIRVRRSAVPRNGASEPATTTARPASASGRATEAGDDEARIRDLENSLRGWVNYGKLRQSAPSAGSILRTVFQTHGTLIPESFTQTADMALLGDSRLVEEAALLYQQLNAGVTSEGDCSIEPLTLEQIGARFAEAVAREHETNSALKVLLTPALLSTDQVTVQLRGRTYSLPAGRNRAVHFDGLAIRNAMGKSFEDLLVTSSFWSNPLFSTWNTGAKRALLHAMFAEIGEDTQYAIGTVQHSLKTVLARIAKYNGEAVVDRFENDEALLQAFQRVEAEWASKRSTFPVHPRLLFATHLANTNGIAVLDSQHVVQRARRMLLLTVTQFAANWEAIVWLSRNSPTSGSAQERATLALDLLRDACLEDGGRPSIPADVREPVARWKEAGLLPEVRIGDTWPEKVATVLESAHEQLLAAFGQAPDFVTGDERLRSHPWVVAKARANVRQRSGEVTTAAEKRELDRMLSGGGFQPPAANRGAKAQAWQTFIDSIPSIGPRSNLTQAMQSKPADETVLGDVSFGNDQAGAVSGGATGKPVSAKRMRGLADFSYIAIKLEIPTNGAAERAKTAKAADDLPDIRVQDGAVPPEHRHLALQVRAGLPGVQWQGHDVVLLVDEDRIVPIERAGDAYREIDWNSGRPAIGKKPIRRDDATGPFRVDWR
ncbi:hypothetical protein [Burkholderia ubonensis]|uniref:hypothetical protein n=1 Tax=Burkholderia ubonensis TaxID=101571 RepID=UPI0012F774B2|nr:hypothetical protein [Burkholderia ubonensis]